MAQSESCDLLYGDGPFKELGRPGGDITTQTDFRHGVMWLKHVVTVWCFSDSSFIFIISSLCIFPFTSYFCFPFFFVALCFCHLCLVASPTLECSHLCLSALSLCPGLCFLLVALFVLNTLSLPRSVTLIKFCFLFFSIRHFGFCCYLWGHCLSFFFK